MLSVEKKQYTSDLIIRKALKKCVEKQYEVDEHPVRILEEFTVCDGAARVDLAAVNGVMHGFEIKSDIDSLSRLPQQIHYYSSVFDKMTLVVGVTHLYDAFNIIPDWWGVTVARMSDKGVVTFNNIRNAERNSDKKMYSVAKLLWKEEALSILEEHGITRGYKSKSRDQICLKLVETFDADSLSEKVRSVIQFTRQEWKVGA